MNEEILDLKLHRISCPRYNGLRCAACCIIYDRYRSCRRHCMSLRDHLIKNPDLAERSKKYFERKKADGGFSESLFDNAYKFSGKNLPDPTLGCEYCKFIAKSERGLRIHMKRTHKKSPKTKSPS